MACPMGEGGEPHFHILQIDEVPSLHKCVFPDVKCGTCCPMFKIDTGDAPTIEVFARFTEGPWGGGGRTADEDEEPQEGAGCLGGDSTGGGAAATHPAGTTFHPLDAAPTIEDLAEIP